VNKVKGLVIVVVVIVIIVIVVMVIIGDVVVAPVGLILGDAGGAERNLSFGGVPIANTLNLSRIPLVLGITTLSNSDDGATDRPAAIGDVVVVQFRCDSNAGK